MAYQEFDPYVHYYLLADGQETPEVVPGWRILQAIEARLPATYWPVADGPEGRP